MKPKISTVLNAVCPYFTMFPLEFPLRILDRLGEKNDVVLDPFCGRGTTNFASRIAGLNTIGIDASAIAIAATSAKLTRCLEPNEIVSEATKILRSSITYEIPRGEFWSLAYCRPVLDALCKLRASLLMDCGSDARKALRGLLLGALHGPLKHSGSSSYFSNQCPRTYAPKPKYAVRYWRRGGFRPPKLDVLEIIEMRARRFFIDPPPSVRHRVRRGDSRRLSDLRKVCAERKPRLVVTSPPYYGLRTYIQDQWLRNWFIGGPEHVDYSYGVQVSHRSIEDFTKDIEKVWMNVAQVCHPKAILVFRFGAINDRLLDPRETIRASLRNTPWRLMTIVEAGSAQHGRRQASSFGAAENDPIVELDAWASLSSS